MEQFNNEQTKYNQFNNIFIYNYREALNKQVNSHGNNIANSMTAGYKSVSSYIDSIKTQDGEFRYSVTDRTNFAQGYLKETKNEFNYAIEGDGFFALECGDQMKYTRAGIFELDKENYIKLPNGCYLLGQLYFNGNQEQVIAIDKFNLTPIKIDTGLIKGTATTTADISLSLSAKQMVLGGGNGELTIDNLVDNDKFSIVFYQKKGYNKSQKFEYNFIFNSDPSKSKFDSDTKKITFNSANKLATLVNNNLDHFIDFAVDQTDYSKIKFEVKSSSGNSNYFTDKAAFAKPNYKVDDSIGHYANEEQKKLAAIPVAIFKDPLKLENEFGTIFSDTASSSGNNVLAKFDSTPQILGKLGLGNYLSAGYVKPNYKADEAELNMAGGKIRADAKTEFNVIDSLGNDHEVFVAFKKIATMKYAVEVYTAKGDVDNSRDDGLIAGGIIKFDSKGNGEIETTSAITGVKSLEDELEFKWADEGQSLAGPNNIKINWNKLQMYDDNQLINIDSNGNKGGILQSTSVDDKGNLTGHYTNGDQKKLAAIPVTLFKSPTEELKKDTGTMFSTTLESDAEDPKYMVSKQDNAGSIISGTFETSNVNNIEEMIIMERVIKQLEILNTFEIKKIRANSCDDFKKMAGDNTMENDAQEMNPDFT